MNASAATLRPTCFMDASARLPAKDAPMATSSATFSLVDHCACRSAHARFPRAACDRLVARQRPDAFLCLLRLIGRLLRCTHCLPSMVTPNGILFDGQTI